MFCENHSASEVSLYRKRSRTQSLWSAAVRAKMLRAVNACGTFKIQGTVPSVTKDCISAGGKAIAQRG